MSTLTLEVTAVHRRRVRWTHVKQRIVKWQHRSRSRAELMFLSEMSLQDIGMGRGEAAFEAAKPFWQS